MPVIIHINHRELLVALSEIESYWNILTGSKLVYKEMIQGGIPENLIKQLQVFLEKEILQKNYF